VDSSLKLKDKKNEEEKLEIAKNKELIKPVIPIIKKIKEI
jgi:hypothetical protein